MSRDLDALTTAYWKFRELLRDPDERAGASTDAWAHDDVDEAVFGPSDDVLEILDALLAAPEADPEFVGVAAIEELVAQHGDRFAADIAARCQTNGAWRIAVGAIELDAAERESVPDLGPFLAI